MKLLASLTSPYARKIRVLLAEKNIPFELVVDSPWESNTLVPSVNPLGKVPVLVTESDTFFDSPVIAGYLELVAPMPPMLPTDPMATLRVRQLEALADGVTDATVTALLESRRPDGQRSDNEIIRQHEKIRRGLDELEKRLGEGPMFGGDRLNLADVAAGCALLYLDLRFPTMNWRNGRPGLAALAAALDARGSFASTRPPL